MRIVILTSTARRHQWMISLAAQRGDLVGVWQESIVNEPLKGTGASDEDAAAIRRHLQGREESEERYFAEFVRTHPVSKKDVLWREVPFGGVNDPIEIDLMTSLKPDVIIDYGSGIVRKPLIERFDGRIINQHLGLSPYYRGAGTNFWALVNREPEYAGVTIHYLDAGIDSGAIICHGRPEIAQGDGPHDIGNKTIIVGGHLLLQAAECHVASGRLSVVPQWEKGKLYQKKDFNADAVRRLWHNFETGMIEEYLSNKQARDHFRLISLPETVAV
nr:hypothetical protein [Nitrospirota bacterium]